MKELFLIIIVKPFYNALILLVDFLTTDLGIAIVILTLVFRFILFPLSKKQIRTQIKMQQVQEPLREIQKKYKDNREQMGKEMMKLYKEHNLNPFSGILLLLIQLPLLFGLYYVFLNSGLPEINSDLLYSFVRRPEYINTTFLGLVDMTAKSLVLALLAGITQFIQMKIILPKKTNDGVGGTGKDGKGAGQGDKSMAGDMMKNMQTQMTYVMPIILGFISYTFGAVIALYILVGNLFSIGQEIYIRKNIKGPEEERIRLAKLANLEKAGATGAGVEK